MCGICEPGLTVTWTCQSMLKTCVVVRGANLHKIGLIRKYLHQSTTKRLVSALVTSRLDYSNSLLAELPAKATAPMQKVQNASARLITRTRKREHITPILHSLHWLPIAQRVKYKVLTLTHKTVIVVLQHLLQHSGNPLELANTIDFVPYRRVLKNVPLQWTLRDSALAVSLLRSALQIRDIIIIIKTATFNLTPSGVTSDLTLTVSWTGQGGHYLGCRLQEWVENKRSVNFYRFGSGDAGDPIDSRVGDLCHHVGFTET
jgi:hypothetical protein